MVGAALFAVGTAALLLDAGVLWIGEVAHGEPAAGVGDPLSEGVVAALAATIAAA